MAVLASAGCAFSSTAPPASNTTALHLNQPLLEQLQQLQRQVLQQLPQAQTLSVADLLRWPGMLAEPHASEDELRAQIAATAVADRIALAGEMSADDVREADSKAKEWIKTAKKMWR